MFFGLLLIALGLLFLLQNLGILAQTTWGIIWPLLIIVLGLSIIFKKNRKIM